METIKEMLENYNEYKAEIKMKKYAIINVENMTLDAGTSNLSGMPSKTGYKDCSTMLFIENRDEKLRNLEKELKELEAKVEMIDSLIATLKEPCRRAITEYYINKKTATMVAYQLEREEKSIFRMMKRSIEQMDKLLKKQGVR